MRSRYLRYFGPSYQIAISAGLFALLVPRLGGAQGAPSPAQRNPSPAEGALPPTASPAAETSSAGAGTAAASEDEDIEVEASTVAPEPAPPSSAPAPQSSPDGGGVAPLDPAEPKVAVAAVGPSAPDASKPAAPSAATGDTPSATAGERPPEIPNLVEREGSNYRRRLEPGFRVSGFVQGQYQLSQLSQDQLDPDGAPLNQDEFGVRRARVRLDHGFDFGFATLEVDAGTIGGASLRLRRAEASVFYRGKARVDQTPWAVLTAGVTDLPFAGELGESQRDRLFMEQSIASRALFPTPADVGVKLWGAFQALEYGVALVNGEPSDGSGFPTDRNAHKDIVGRFGFLTGLGGASQLGGGVSFYTGRGFSTGSPGTKDSLIWVDINNNGAVEPAEIQGTTGSAAVPSEDFDRWATALDVSARVKSPLGVTRAGGEVFLASNLDRGLVPSDPVTVGGDALALGGSFYVVQSAFSHLLVGVRASYYDPNSNLIEQRAGTFHLKDQSFVELSPSLAVSIDKARLSAQYDFIFDHLGRNSVGVPTDTRNDRFTLRLQVDL